MSNASLAEDMALDSLVARVADEFRDRQSRGEKPDIEGYAAQHPHAADLLRKVLGALELIAQSLPGGMSEAIAAGESHTGTLGDFRLIREVGRGGMGIVYEAEQISLGRRVALKVLPFAATMDPRHLQRFQNEARAAASLEHPHIVPVYGVGCERGVHYYAMKYIEGQSLAEVIDEVRKAKESHHRGTENTEKKQNTKISSSLCSLCLCGSKDFFKSVAELGIQAAEALEHAHSLGIVHRDIKPANLMIDGHGALWITDFGLARTAADAGLTMTGDVLGTLRYMSPEQALAKHGLMDHRTDIYSLGVTLYELLAGRPAVEGKDREEILNAITLEEAPAMRKLEASIPRDLETIVLKAIGKEPGERYAAAQDLADDLRSWLEDKPIQAQRPSAAQRVVKWSRRHKVLVQAAFAVLAVISVALVASTWLLSREQKKTADERDRTAEERDRAQTNLDLAFKVLDEIYMARIEEGFPRGKDLKPEDREFLQKTIRFYQQFAAQDAQDVSAREKSATGYARLGEIQGVLGLFAESEVAFRQALDVWEALAAEFPNEPRYQLELANICHLLTKTIYFPQVRLKDGEAAELKGQVISQRLVDQYPEVAEYRYQLARNLNGLGLILLRLGRRPEGESHFCRAIEIAEELIKQDSKVPKYRSGLALNLSNFGVILLQSGRQAEAERCLRRSIEIHETLVREFPDRGDYQELLAAPHAVLGVLLHHQGRHAEAEKEYRANVELLRQLAERAPMSDRPMRLATEGYGNLAGFLSDSGRWAEAEAEYRKAVKIMEEQARRPRVSGKGRASMAAGTYNAFAWFLVTRPDVLSRDPIKAVALAKKAIEISPQAGSFWNTLGIAHYRAGEWNAAIAALEKSMKLAKGGDSADWFFLAMANWQLRQKQQARKWYDQAVQWMDKNKPKDEELGRFRSEAAELLGLAASSRPELVPPPKQVMDD